MRIDVGEYQKRHPGCVDRTTFSIDGETHDGYILYRDGTEEWVSVSGEGKIKGFGKGDRQVRYKKAKHSRKFSWLNNYKED